MSLRLTVASVAVAALSTAASAGSSTTFSFPLGGDQQNPPVSTSAFGTGSITYDTNTMTFDIEILVEGITTGLLLGVGPNSTPLHIHNAPAGSNGGIVVDLGLFGTLENVGGPFGGGTGFRYTASGLSINGQESNLFDGNLYVNIHTTSFGGGEIRGQIVPAPAAVSLLGLGGLATLRRKR